MRLNRSIARGQLVLIGVEQFEVLLEHKDVLGPVMPGEGGRDLGLRGLTPARRMRRPVTPVISLITMGSWRFIWISAFCMRWTCVAALCPGPP